MVARMTTDRAGGPRIESDAALALRIARQAGELLLRLQREPGAEGTALGDRGDAESNALILTALREARPDDAVLSEESTDDPARLVASRVWIVDPLDGTREYCRPPRSDWAVHIALWEHNATGGSITAAAVTQPALDFAANTEQQTAPEQQATTVDSESAAHTDKTIRLVVSDSRPPAFIGELGARLGAEVHTMGSAGAKAMAVLRGEFDAYVHAGGQYEWDSAAPVGVVIAAGFVATRLDGTPLLYNRADPYLPDLVICRPSLATTILSHLRECAI
jgi:3'(2'), 5'-bisphosphate nucleotidase